MDATDRLYKKVISRLENELPTWLTYHDLAHTMRVYENAVFIGIQEKITPEELYLLKTAAMYHDSGYLFAIKNHEEESCKVVRNELPGEGFSSEEIDFICDIIMATQIPQNPKNKLGKILADADLEYLGTDEFDEISSKLHTEILHFRPEMTEKEWYELQISFLSKHRYHTAYCIENREKIKLGHLEKIKEKVKTLS